MNGPIEILVISWIVRTSNTDCKALNILRILIGHPSSLEWICRPTTPTLSTAARTSLWYNFRFSAGYAGETHLCLYEIMGWLILCVISLRTCGPQTPLKMWITRKEFPDREKLQNFWIWSSDNRQPISCSSIWSLLLIATSIRSETEFQKVRFDQFKRIFTFLE
jgi:hypothetical protein